MNRPRNAPADDGGHPNFWASLLLCVLLVAAMGWLRLVVFSDRQILLTYALPLLVCLWNRDLRLLYAMSVVFSGMAVYKGLWLLGPGALGPTYQYVSVAMQLTNIWIVTGVVHGLIVAMGRVERKNRDLALLNDELTAANEELNAANEELSSREEEIARQNEELQSQAAELEQQTEESRQQAEEFEQQSIELQHANAELARREQGLHTLLESARWLRTELDEQLVLNGLCHAAVQVIGDEAAAAAVTCDAGGALGLRGQWGVGLSGTIAGSRFGESFSSLVLERGHSCFIEDLTLRPDLRLPDPAAGRPFRSVLGTAVWCDGKPVAVLEVYAVAPRQWTEEQFRLVEWFAAQAALAMRAIRSQRELEQKRGQAEEASVRKTQFLAAVSHDVRTPANAISLLAHLIEKTAAVPERVHEVQKMARDLRANARALTELVSDVLDLARFDTGQIEPQPAEFSLDEMVSSEVTQSRPVAEAKGVRLTADLPAPEVWLRTDRIKLSRVLGNLVGNAIKFTREGAVSVRRHRRADGGVDVCVADTGIGISGQHLPRIFDEFFQLHNPERDRTKGTGLGLAICRRLADAIGCRLRVESAAGAGSTFTIEIPPECVLAAPPPHARVHDGNGHGDGHGDGRLAADGIRVVGASHPNHRPLAGCRVLLVEDHDVTRQTVARLLASAGAAVDEAADGRAALRLLQADAHFDAVLLDLMLPDMDGTEILRSLKENRPSRLRCVLAVSGDVRDVRVEAVRHLGADDLLPKPVSLDRLLAMLRACGVGSHTPAGYEGDRDRARTGPEVASPPPPR